MMDRRERLIDRAREGFQLVYGTEPTHFFAAPGRVNLIGEHVDYNAGYVLPCAIDRETIVALGAGEGNLFEATALDMAEMGSARDDFSLDAPIVRADQNWRNHVRGVVHALAGRGHRLKPARIAIASDVPIGVGLSSSAALGVAVALACAEHSGLNLSPDVLAKVAQAAENDFVGCACGIMDQMASASSTAGHALLLDCRSLEHMPIPIHESLVITVINTGLRRELTGSAFNLRRAECKAAARHYGVAALRDLSPEALERARGWLDDVHFARARHVVSEIARVEPVALALAQGDSAVLAALLAEAHRSLADDFDVSLPPIDRLVGLVAEALGTAGGVRLTGAGFGGCLVAVADRTASWAIDDAVARYNTTASLPASSNSFAPAKGAAPIVFQ
ncbi:galactokinase [Blastomonas sp.]|uniref:galactokinase n=1 Tax=Blastomonas sp. TaxID=1909299 RepID=UPI00359326E4